MARSQQAAAESRGVKLLKAGLVVLLCMFTAASVVFSLFVLFTDLGKSPEVTPEQARGLFTVFIYQYIDQVHPNKLTQGKTWNIKDLEFPNKNFAVVEATDGQIRTKLQFIYVVEYPNVRVLKINDITNLDHEDAKLVLIRFLDFMEKADYSNAAVLYDGPVSRLTPYGSATSPLPQLLAGYCAAVAPAKRCLPFVIKESSKDPVTGEYQFVVNYRMPDTTVYKLENGKEDFVSLVRVSNDDYKVITLPFD